MQANLCSWCQAVLPADQGDGICPMCRQEKDLSPSIHDETTADHPTPSSEIDVFDPLKPPRNGRFAGYELLDVIAHGGMGVVYRARQLSLNRIVALKVIRAGHLATPSDVERFRIEARAAAHLEHPRIVPIYDVGEYRGVHYFSMKLVEGGNLAQHMHRYVADHRAGAILLQGAARGIHYAHQRGILHRDLKPANILIDTEGRPHVVDFGVAKRVTAPFAQDGSGASADPESATSILGGIVGTPSYMAPEQAEGGGKALTATVDVYSLGAILYEMLTGSPPFKAATQMATLRQVIEQRPRPPQELNPKVDPELAAICMKCLERDPADRYQTAEEFEKDLERWLNGDMVFARPPGYWQLVRTWLIRQPAALVVMATALGIVAGLLSSFWPDSSSQLSGARADTADGPEPLPVVEPTGPSQGYFNRIHLAAELIDSGALTRAGTVLASCSKTDRGWEWHYLHRLCQPQCRVIGQESASVTRLCINGDRLLVATADGSVRYEDLKRNSGGAIVRLETPPVTALAISKNGYRIAAADAAGRVHVWQPQAGQREVTLAVARGVCRWLAFAADERIVLVHETEQDAEQPASVVGVWDFAAQRLVTRKLPEPCTSLVASANGALVAVGLADGTVQLRRLPDLASAFSWRSSEAAVSALTISTDGHSLACGHANGALFLYDLSSGRRRADTRLDEKPLSALAFRDDGSLLIGAESWSGVRWWNPQSGRVISIESPASAESSPPGPAIAVSAGWVGRGLADGRVRLWSIGGQSGSSAVRIDAQLQRVSFSRDGDHALVQDESDVHLADLLSGRIRWSHHCSEDPGRCWAALEPESQSVIVADPAGTIRFLERATGVEQQALATDVLEGTAFAWHAKTGTIALGCRSGMVSVWDVAARKCVWQRSILAEVTSLAFSRDGTQLAVGGADGVIRIRTATSLQRIDTGSDGAVVALAFQPNAELLASVLVDGSCVLWDVRRLARHATLLGHFDRVNCLTYDRTGRRIVTGGNDGLVKLWDVASARDILTLSGHSAPIVSVDFTADGRRLLTADASGLVRIWDGTPAASASEPVASTAGGK